MARDTYRREILGNPPAAIFFPYAGHGPARRI
jgi:hypothetical protein